MSFDWPLPVARMSHRLRLEAIAECMSKLTRTQSQYAEPLMSALGHSRHRGDVRPMSALPLFAPWERTLSNSSDVPQGPGADRRAARGDPGGDGRRL